MCHDMPKISNSPNRVVKQSHANGIGEFVYLQKAALNLPMVH